MPFQSIVMDERLPSSAASGPSAAVVTTPTPSQGNMPILLEEMPDHWTLAYGVAPEIPQPTGETPASPQGSTEQPIVAPRIPSTGRNDVVITTPHPRLANHPPRIYRERAVRSGSPGHRALYLVSPLAEPSGSYPLPTRSHDRTIEWPENKPPPGSSGRTPYFYTPSNLGERPLADANNIGRYTNRQRRTGPQLRFQFDLREPQLPARPVLRPEPVMEVLEEDDLKDEVPRDMETNEDEGMDLVYLNSAALF